MSLSPIFKSPFTDFGGAILSHQWGSRCGGMELKALDCMEAYGIPRGVEKCDALIKDFQECATRKKQWARFDAMKAERKRQYWAGERTKENRYAEPPKADSY